LRELGVVVATAYGRELRVASAPMGISRWFFARAGVLAEQNAHVFGGNRVSFRMINDVRINSFRMMSAPVRIIFLRARVLAEQNASFVGGCRVPRRMMSVLYQCRL